MQRWSIGQSARKQGRQNTGSEIAATVLRILGRRDRECCSARRSDRRCRRPARRARPQMQRARIVRDERADSAKARPSASADPSGRRVDALDVARGIAIFAAAEDHARSTPASPQQRRQLGIPLRRPSLGVAEGRARRNAHQRLAGLSIRAPAATRAAAHACGRHLELRRQRPGLDAELADEIRIVLAESAPCALRPPHRSREQRPRKSVR